MRKIRNFHDILKFAYSQNFCPSSVDTHHYNMTLIHWDDHMWCVKGLKTDLLVYLYQDDLH